MRMEDAMSWALRVGTFVGIGLFLWSAAGSLEQIARAFTRIADAAERHAGTPPPQAPDRG
jgi:hypothetical protein